MALYGIKKIEYCTANSLAFSGPMNEFFGIASELTNALTALDSFVRNRSTLSIEESIENKELIYTCRLTFVTPDYPALSADNYAFVVTTNAGERILIGAQFRPRVVVMSAQNVSATPGELTAYTTTAEWRTNYRPLRLPVSEPEPVAGPAYEICCGQVVATHPATIYTVIWQNYDGTELDRKTYVSGQPEPTTSVVPTKPGDAQYNYVFNSWEVYSSEGTTKIYRPTFTQTAVIYTVRWINYDDTLVAEETYTYGQPEPTTSVVPTKPSDAQYSYTFNAWELYSQSGTVKTYKATYTQTAVIITVIWLNSDGTVLEQTTYQAGQPEPSCSQTPTKAETDDYDYTFNSWNLVSDVNNVKTYEPIFNEIYKWEVKSGYSEYIKTNPYIECKVTGSGLLTSVRITGYNGEGAYNENVYVWNADPETEVHNNILANPKYGIATPIASNHRSVYITFGNAVISNFQVHNPQATTSGKHTGYFYKNGIIVGYYHNQELSDVQSLATYAGVTYTDI